MDAGHADVSPLSSLQQGLGLVEGSFHIEGGHTYAKNIDPRPLQGLGGQGAFTQQFIRGLDAREGLDLRFDPIVGQVDRHIFHIRCAAW